MPSKTVVANRSSILADTNAGTMLGGGLDQHLSVIANPGGYDLRGLIGFTFPAGFWTDIRQITKVELRLTGTSAVGHVSKGASRKAIISRLIGSWSANTAGESWTTTPAVYPGPASTSSGRVTPTMPASGATLLLDITAIGVAWAPATVKGPTGSPGGGAVQYGLSLTETGGAAEAAEVYSAAWGTSSQRPALVYTYTSNAPPDAPTLIRPAGPDQGASIFEAQGRDPEGDSITTYDLQVSTDPTFSTVTHWSLANQTANIDTAGHLQRNYGGTPLVDGTRYYWRVRMKDAGSASFGPWSGVGTFVKAPGGGPADDLYDYWMTAILSNMAAGRTAVRLGTLRPLNEEVAVLICAEFGDLFHLAWDETTPPIAEDVYILGERVALSPDGWAVDAIVELKREVG